jgi:hypothetical protein
MMGLSGLGVSDVTDVKSDLRPDHHDGRCPSLSSSSDVKETFRTKSDSICLKEAQAVRQNAAQ